MNGEVSLIVKTITKGPGNTSIDTGSGYVTSFVSPNEVYVVGDWTGYIGKYVDLIQSGAPPINMGTFLITNATYDGVTYTKLFTTQPWNLYAFPTIIAYGFTVYDAVDVTTEAYLDLYENESISQNWQYTDLNNFASLGAFSREFRVPFSDRNQDALGPLFDVNFSAGTDNYFHYKLPAEIRVDTLPIASGYIRVRKIYKQRNKISEVEFAFYAETPDLYKNIGEKKLKDLVALNDLNEVMDWDTVFTLNGDRLWTLCDRGQLWSENGQAGTRRITDPDAPAYLNDLTPAVNWRYIFEAIIAEAGFSLNGATISTILNDYWMPWCNNQELQTDDLGAQYLFRVYNAAPITIPAQFTNYAYSSLVEAYDNNADFDPTTGIYTAPGGGRYTFRYVLNFQATSYSGTAVITRVSVKFRINGVIDYDSENDSFFNSSQSFTQTRGYDLNAGDTVELLYYYQTRNNQGVDIGNANVSIVAGSGDLNLSNFELIGTRFHYGQTFGYQQNAPDIRQIDFLQDVLKMHNCVIIPDRINQTKVSIIPYDDYVGTGDIVDWTQKLDTDKDLSIYSTVELQKQKTLFTYAAGDDYLNKLYKDQKRVFGQYDAVGYTINPNTAPSDYLTGSNTVQLVTQATPCGYIDGTITPIPQFINDNNEFVLPQMRCLYAAGNVSMYVYNDNVLDADLTSIATLSNYSVTIPSIGDADLNWAPETPPYPINASPYYNLFNLYWRSYMNQLYSPDARIMEAFFALDLTDILSFGFDDIVIIDNARWRILEIQDYKVGQFESTKVKLIKYIEPAIDCAATPSSIELDGQVNFVDANGSPTTASQDCCTRYGYNWNEQNGECYASFNFNNTPVSGITGTRTNVTPRWKQPAMANTNTRSVSAGPLIDISLGNDNLIAVGDTIKLDEQVRGNAMFGKNVYTKQPGLHLGGGWTLDDRSQAEGGHQYGIILFGSKDALAASGDIIQPTIENTGVHLNMIDDSYWAVLLHVNVTDMSTYTTYNALHMVTLQKQGSNAAATGAVLISEDNGFGTVNFAINIDVATVTTEHRIEIITTGTGYPYIFHTTVTLQYTAVR